MSKTERELLEKQIESKKTRVPGKSTLTGRFVKQPAGRRSRPRRRQDRGSGDDDETGLGDVDPSTHSGRDARHFRRIVAAKEALEAAERELRDAVVAAREAGDSWTVIGAALETSRQNAFQRFGKVIKR